MQKLDYRTLCFFLSVLVFLTAAHAGDEPECRVGIGLGLEYLNLEAKINDDFSAFDFTQFGSRKQTKKAFQVAPSFEIGMLTCNNLYIGLAASWRYSGAHTKDRAPLKNLAFFMHQFKLTSYANFLAKLGYKIAPKTMVYGLIGPSIAKWSHKTELFDQEDEASKSFKTDTFKKSKTNVGLGLGFGFEYFICDKVAFSIDYMHAFYKTTTARKTASFLDNIGGENVLQTGLVSKKIKPSYDTIAARITYFF